ncbi:MAG: hypothetical protein KKB88_00510 [Nanoarchaeota archaeon]|nr:hypothetical protein [Nanoarchaeota archaeon]
MEYKKGECLRITRKDSVYKIKEWEISRIEKEKQIGGKVEEVIFLKNKSVRQPLRVDKKWLGWNATKVKCK